MSWPTLELGDLVDAKTGFASGENVPDGIVQIRMNNITSDGALDWSKIRRVPLPKKGVSDLLAESGDILFNATNSPDLVGKSAYFSDFGEPVTFSNHFLRLRPKPSLSGLYLAHWLQVQWRAGVFKGLCRAWVNQASVSREHLLALRVPLPPLDEQRRIAAILDQADALRRKRREALAAIDALQSSLFATTFTSDAARTWPLETVANLALNVRTGPFGSQLLHSEFVESGIPVLGIDNAVRNEFQWSERRYITEDKYQELKRYTVQPRDILITIMGTCGRCAIVPDDIPLAINTKHLCCITPDQGRILPSFLHAALLQNPDILKQLGVQSKGAVMPGLNMGIIKALQLRLPPIELQQQFAEQLTELKEQRDRGRAHLAHLDALFASLQHRAFRGEL